MPTYGCVCSTKHRQAPSRGPWCDWNSAAANKKKGKHFHLSGLGKKDLWASDSSASICWYVDNTYGHTDICEVASNGNQINHRSQHVICLIMSNTSHFLSVQKALCERADGAAGGWHQPWQLQMQSIYTARRKNGTTQAASWERDSNLNKCHQTKYTYLLMLWTYLIQSLSSNQIYTGRPGSDAMQTALKSLRTATWAAEHRAVEVQTNLSLVTTCKPFKPTQAESIGRSPAEKAITLQKQLYYSTVRAGRQDAGSHPHFSDCPLEFSPVHLACEMTRCSPDMFLPSKCFSFWVSATIKKLLFMSPILQVCCAL